DSNIPYHEITWRRSDSYPKNDGCYDEIPFSIQGDLCIDQNSESACRDDSEKQYRNSAHDRRRYRLDQCRELAHKSEDDREYRSASDDPYAEHPRNRKDTDVLAVSRRRRTADQACEHRRRPVTDQ